MYTLNVCFSVLVCIHVFVVRFSLIEINVIAIILFIRSSFFLGCHRLFYKCVYMHIFVGFFFNFAFLSSLRQMI